MCIKICEIVLAAVLLLFGILNISAELNKWVLIVVGVILLVHSFACKNCCGKDCKNEIERIKAKKKR